jgi:hypothetical protein
MKITLILEAFTRFMEAAAEYLRLRSLSYTEDLIERKQKKRDEIVAQIEKLRSSGKSSDADVADLLRKALIENDRTLKYLLSKSADLGKGSDDSN